MESLYIRIRPVMFTLSRAVTAAARDAPCDRPTHVTRVASGSRHDREEKTRRRCERTNKETGEREPTDAQVVIG